MGNGTVWRGAGSGDREGAKASSVDSEAADFFENYLPPMPPRRYVSGETHRYHGRQYRLKVIKGAEEGVKLKGRYLLGANDTKARYTPRKDLAKGMVCGACAVGI